MYRWGEDRLSEDLCRAQGQVHEPPGLGFTDLPSSPIYRMQNHSRHRRINGTCPCDPRRFSLPLCEGGHPHGLAAITNLKNHEIELTDDTVKGLYPYLCS